VSARAVALGATLVAGLAASRAAWGQSFVQEVSDDACEEAHRYPRADDSPAAQHARRACRLQRFEVRLREERREEVAAQVDQRNARVERWLETTQSARVVHPLAVEGLMGTGLARYGLAVSYMLLRQLELAALIGWRSVETGDADPTASGAAQYGNRTLAFTGRWYAADRPFTPFVGAGIGLTTADLTVFWYGRDGSPAGDLIGAARGHSMTAHAGVQLATRNLRFSLEYVFSYVFFTGANLDDMDKTPSEQMRTVWQETLDEHRHGLQVRVGYAF
jgi:opacity protein-like surface antigen